MSTPGNSRGVVVKGVVLENESRMSTLTQSIVTLLRRDFDAGGGLAQAGSLYDAARIVGEQVRRVDSLDALDDAVREARRLDVPAVIEVPIDPTEYHAHAR